jgi:hypothetical protein
MDASDGRLKASSDRAANRRALDAATGASEPVRQSPTARRRAGTSIAVPGVHAATLFVNERGLRRSFLSLRAGFSITCQENAAKRSTDASESSKTLKNVA